MRNLLKWLPAVIAIIAMCIPTSALADLLSCINGADSDFNGCMRQAVVKGVVGAIVGGVVGVLGGIAGIGIGASAGFLNGTAGSAYACEDNYISDTDACYAQYPRMI